MSEKLEIKLCKDDKFGLTKYLDYDLISCRSLGRMYSVSGTGIVYAVDKIYAETEKEKKKLLRKIARMERERRKK